MPKLYEILDPGRRNDCRQMLNLYTISAGMRGPDHEEEAGHYLAKAVLTAVIRFFFIPEAMSVADVAGPEWARKTWETETAKEREATRLFLRRHSHFARHAFDALLALDDPAALEYLEWFQDELYKHEEVNHA